MRAGSEDLLLQTQSAVLNQESPEKIFFGSKQVKKKYQTLKYHMKAIPLMLKLEIQVFKELLHSFRTSFNSFFIFILPSLKRIIEARGNQHDYQHISLLV